MKRLLIIEVDPKKGTCPYIEERLQSAKRSFGNFCIYGKESRRCNDKNCPLPKVDQDPEK